MAFIRRTLLPFLLFVSKALLVRHTSASPLKGPLPFNTAGRRSPFRWRIRGGSLSNNAGKPDVAKVDMNTVRTSSAAANPDRMPSLFGPEEAQYDRYAACLAATEGLRKIRDRALEKEGKRPFRMSAGTKASESEGTKRANAQYVLNSGKVLRALGMSVSQFNQCGRQISNDPALKEKVMEQAYLYRMAATLNMDRVPLIEDPASERLLKATKRERIKMFCKSMTQVEQLRSDQMEKLKRTLHVDKLPKGVNISDPAILPFLSPKVRAVVEAFPLQAEEIVKKHGLQSDEFNKMLEEAKTNPVFRWRVERHLSECS